ncbi:MAG: hypothetical protein IT201_08600 [Thermoleophilia bacterium]|nr:hypothetical protein [Thermoleophilia bacterium]
MANERLTEIFDALVEAGRAVIAEKKVTEAELDAAGTFLTAVAAEGQLVDFIDLMGYTAAADQQAARQANPNAQVIGPRWKEGAPVKPSGVLYEGDPPEGLGMLKVSGRLYDRDTGKGIEGAQVDFWHVREDGEYDLTGYDQRGKIVTGQDGAYEFDTLQPTLYKVHDGDLVEELFARMGRGTYRARHIHVKVWIDGKEVLTSQFFDASSPYIDQDILYGSVRPELLAAEWKEVGRTADGRAQFEAKYDIPVCLNAA